MNTNEREALRTFGILTGGSFNVYRLAGPHNAGNRQLLMACLETFKRPKAACGVNLIAESFYQLAARHGHNASDKCNAVRRDLFSAWAQAQIAEPETVTV